MKDPQGRSPFVIKDFSGGLLTKTPPKNIDPKYSIDCLNVYSEGLMLRKRAGITALNATAATGAGNGIYNFVRGSATTAQWLMAFWGAGLWKMAISGTAWDGTWSAITADAASGTAFTTAGGTAYFANFNGVVLISNEGREHIQKMTVSDASYLNIEVNGTGTAPLSKFVTVWKNHAWFINCVGSEDQVVHSSVNSYNNFTGDTYGSNNILTENDIGLTGSFVLNGRLFVTKSFSLHRFTYTGSPSPLVDIRPIKTIMGTKSPRTIKNISTPDGESVLFLGSNKKLYACDGQDITDVSEQVEINNGISSFSMQSINANALNNCFAVVHEDLNWYELFVCLGTTTTPNCSFVFDYKMKSFWPMGNRNFVNGVISDNGAGKRVVYVQGTNGISYLLNDGNSDAGTAINGYWISGKIGPSIYLERFDEVEVETDSVVCTPTFSWRADWESTWISQIMKASQNSHNWNPGRIDNLIQFKILDNSSDPTFKIWTLIGNKRSIGGGK